MFGLVDPCHTMSYLSNYVKQCSFYAQTFGIRCWCLLALIWSWTVGGSVKAGVLTTRSGGGGFVAFVCYMGVRTRSELDTWLYVHIYMEFDKRNSTLYRSQALASFVSPSWARQGMAGLVPGSNNGYYSCWLSFLVNLTSICTGPKYTSIYFNQENEWSLLRAGKRCSNLMLEVEVFESDGR